MPGAPGKNTQIKEVQNKIQWIKDNLNAPGSPIREIYSTKSPKRDLIVKWASYVEQLATLGVYKKPLSSISTFITGELRAMGLTEAVPYVSEVLPFKYKDPSRIHNAEGINTSPDQPDKISSKLKTRFKKENKNYIVFLKAAQNIIGKVIAKMEKENFCSLLEQDELEEFLLRGNQAVQQLKEALDGRTEVPYTRQHIFIFAFVHATMNHAYAHYIKDVKKYEKITPKQAGKIIRGEVKHLQLLFEPKDRIQAINVGFYGFPCDYCGSWRVKVKWQTSKSQNTPYCFKCGKFNEDLKTEILRIKENH